MASTRASLLRSLYRRVHPDLFHRQPAAHAQRPAVWSHAPRPASAPQPDGHGSTGISHASPRHAVVHTHAPAGPHAPCSIPPQSAGHPAQRGRGREQSSPSCSSSHTHRPPTHRPALEQPDGQPSTGSAQPTPRQNSSHTHCRWWAAHVPWPEQLPGHPGDGTAHDAPAQPSKQ